MVFLERVLALRAPSSHWVAIHCGPESVCKIMLPSDSEGPWAGLGDFQADSEVIPKDPRGMWRLEPFGDVRGHVPVQRSTVELHPMPTHRAPPRCVVSM